MQNHIISSERGMSLLVVLMLTAMASVLVFSALNNALSQERMSGNFQKQLNAEQMADQAAYASFHQLNKFVQDPANADKPIETLVNVAQIANTPIAGSRQFSAMAQSFGTDTVRVNALGQRFTDSQATNKVIFKRVAAPGSNVKPFRHAVTGCEGVNLKASGGIESFDSTQPNATTTNVVVQTLKPGADVILDGAAPIRGDVLSRGNITMTGSAVVKGKVHANGNITLNNASATIEQQVWARGDILIGNTVNILGEVKAHGKLDLTSPATLAGGFKTKRDATITSGLLINGPVQVQRDLEVTAWVADSTTIFTQKNQIFYSGARKSPTPANFGTQVALSANQFPDVPLLPVDNNDAKSPNFNPLCDPINITQAIATIKPPAQLDSFRPTVSASVFVLGNTEAKFRDTAQGTYTQRPVTASFLGSNRQMYQFKDVTIQNATLVIDGDITLYVRDLFHLSSASRLEITKGSTLTLITAGHVIFESDAKVRDGSGNKPVGLVNGKPVFSIYSSFAKTEGQAGNPRSDKAGIDISGAADGIYAAIYAPLTDIKIAGIGSNNYFSGAAIGKTVNISGAGRIRYDQALGNIGGGGSVKPVTPPRIVFNGWS